METDTPQERAFQMLSEAWAPKPENATEAEWRAAVEKSFTFAAAALSFALHDLLDLLLRPMEPVAKALSKLIRRR